MSSAQVPQNNKELYKEVGRVSGVIDQLNQRLGKIETNLETIKDQLASLQGDMSNLKGKASVWGALAGMVFGSLTGAVLKLLFWR